MNKTCYYCGAPATSNEHVPPKAIFPKQGDVAGVDYRKNLITVPSCDEHNGEKSKDDDYFAYVVAMSISSNHVAAQQFKTRIMRAMKENDSLIKRLTKNHQPVIAVDTADGSQQHTIALQVEHERLIKILTAVAKGVYFAEMGVAWKGKVVIVEEFTLQMDNPSTNDTRQKLSEFLSAELAGEPNKGSNPEVFSYQMVRIQGEAVVRFFFYENTRAVALFKS